ncbi:PTS sugar transporter subunit IIA [Paeniglutamicibacter antarcticus]|uniref:Fructose PTS transporter subunit IIA n=1 Tax=Paeniglutamicibacter antarcticus TaxID=494023 RepID=A0ABP9TTR3_9MICC
MNPPQPRPAGDEAPEITIGEMVALELATPSREETIAVLAAKLVGAGRITDLPAFLSEVHRHEHQLATGLPGGIGLAHARSDYVRSPSIAVGVMAYGRQLDFGAADGVPAQVVLLLATPATSYSGHLMMLAALARSLAKEPFRESLRRANDPGVIAELINSTVDFSIL